LGHPVLEAYTTSQEYTTKKKLSEAFTTTTWKHRNTTFLGENPH